MSTPHPSSVPSARLDHLDATRAFALLLGIVFHASLSFMPIYIGWAVQDVSTSGWVAAFVTVSHSFRMELFFLLAGFFACVVVRRHGVGAFVRSRAVRLAVPFVVGWFAIRPLLVSGWMMGAASLRGDVDFWGGIRFGFESLKTLPDGLFVGTHLWFLYYLMMITALVLAARALIGATGAAGDRLLGFGDKATAWLAGSRWRLPLLALPTAALLWFMQMWGMDTPDRSLLPHVPVTLVYGGCFVLGWMLARQDGLLDRCTRLSWTLGVVAIAAVLATLVLAPIQGLPSHPQFLVARTAYVCTYAMMMWSLVFLTVGAFRRWCNRPRPVVRYVSDASYWLYLAHLPVVVWLQVAVAEWEIHWLLKLVFVSVATIGGLLAIYDLVVRPTVIGRLLNGRRKPRAFIIPPASARPMEA